MVDRISKLLNQAERAEEGSPEREAFMERALALSQAYSIDLAVARAHQAKKERVEEPERRSFRVGADGWSRNKNAHLVDLMLAICGENDVECVISYSNKFVHGTGMPSDLDMVERLFALLSVQMVQEADAGLKRGDNGTKSLRPKTQRVEIPEDERAWGQHWEGGPWTEAGYYDERDEELKEVGGKLLRYRWNSTIQHMDWMQAHPPPKFKNVVVLGEDGEPVMEEKWTSTTDARTWRNNFYAGFVNRTRYRLREARQQALRDAGIDLKDEGDTRALALRDKAKEVREAFEENERHVLANGSTYGGAQLSNFSSDGQLAGDEAGKRAVLGNERDLRG